MSINTIIGILFTIILGISLHFTYEISGNNKKVALFSAVNESTWEHLKLLFFPFLLYSIYEYFLIGQCYPNFFTAKTIGISFGLIVIPIVYRFLKNIIKSPEPVNGILAFIIGVLVTFFVSDNILENPNIEFNILGIFILLILTLAFFVFTFYPPHTDIFLDPVTNTYGI